MLEVLQHAPQVREILVVDDGSEDDTAEVATDCGVRVIRLPENQGKGTALRTGAIVARGDLLVFFDADLRGLTLDHVRALIVPVLDARADMTVGEFRGGRAATDLAQFLAPHISGQRCLFRDFFLSVPFVEGSRSGVEIALTVHAHACKLTVFTVLLPGITHTLKEEKLGIVQGSLARGRMYLDIFSTLGQYYLTTREHPQHPVVGK